MLPFDTGQQFQGERHRVKETQFWTASLRLTRASLVLSGIAVAGAIASAILALGALNAARDQIQTAQQTLVAQSRPWVKVDSPTINKLQINADGVELQATIKGKNMGHSPAERVTILPWLLLPDIISSDSKPPDPRGKTEEACRQGMRNHLGSDGAASGAQTLIFPNDAKALGYGEAKVSDTIGAAEIEKAGQARDIPYRTWLVLVGCITYKSAMSSNLHQTSFAFYIWHRPPGSELGTQDVFDLTKHATMLTTDITLSEAGFGDIVN